MHWHVCGHDVTACLAGIRIHGSDVQRECDSQCYTRPSCRSIKPWTYQFRQVFGMYDNDVITAPGLGKKYFAFVERLLFIQLHALYVPHCNAKLTTTSGKT